MKYLVMIYGTTEDRAGAEGSALTALKDELAASGELVDAEGLTSPRDGRVVRVRDGAKLVTDGPFVEAGEQLAGFFMVDVADDERAQQIAARAAAAVHDRVELRGTLLTAP